MVRVAKESEVFYKQLDRGKPESIGVLIYRSQIDTNKATINANGVNYGINEIEAGANGVKIVLNKE